MLPDRAGRYSLHLGILYVLVYIYWYKMLQCRAHDNNSFGMKKNLCILFLQRPDKSVCASVWIESRCTDNYTLSQRRRRRRCRLRGA